MSYVAKSRRPLRRIANRSAMGSNQSMPSTHRVASRVTDGLGGYSPSTFSPSRGLVAVPPPQRVTNYRPARNVTLVGGGSNYNAYTGLGSLGDDAAPAAEPSIGTDPVVLAQQQLAELKIISAAQVEFTKREAQQRWVQIGATLLIPLSAAIWRAIFRGGRAATKDYE